MAQTIAANNAENTRMILFRVRQLHNQPIMHSWYELCHSFFSLSKFHEDNKSFPKCWNSICLGQLNHCGYGDNVVPATNILWKCFLQYNWCTGRQFNCSSHFFPPFSRVSLWQRTRSTVIWVISTTAFVKREGRKSETIGSRYPLSIHNLHSWSSSMPHDNSRA